MKSTEFGKYKKCERDFPGSPVVQTSPSNTGGAGSIPGQGARIPHASWPKHQNIKQKQYCNKFTKDFKNGPHQKKKCEEDKNYATQQYVNYTQTYVIFTFHKNEFIPCILLRNLHTELPSNLNIL